MKKYSKILIYSFLLLTILAAFYQPNKVDATPPLSIDKQLEKNDTPASHAYKLLDQQKLALIQGGWLYLKVHRAHDIDAEGFGHFSNGQVIPPETLVESWFHIDRGLIDRSITIQSAMNGEIAQVGVYSDGTGWNTAVDEIVQRAPIRFTGFDFGLLRELGNSTLQVSPITEDGKSLLKFSLTTSDDKPAVLGEYKQLLVSMTSEYFFDQDSGFLARLKQTAYLEDGSQRVFNLTSVEYKIDSPPPPEVLAYFEKKQAREGLK